MRRVEYGTGRNELLQAAIHVVAAQGLRGLTFRSVAAEAGVTHGAVQYHFGSWNNLVAEALGFAVKRSIDTAGLKSAGPGFEDFADALVASVASDPELQAFQFELSLEARRRPELLPTAAQGYDAYRSAVREALTAAGSNDPALGEIVMVALDGLVFQQTVFNDAERTQKALAALRGLLAAHAVREGFAGGAANGTAPA
jgi:AcrR family transcriptional regulator